MHSFTLKKLDHNVMTLSPCTLAFVPHDTIREITERYPDLARIYWFGTNLDAAIHREWELSLGQRSAASRLAHLLCELRVRLQVVGLADESGYDLPLTQAELSECTGMTPVHLNRMLKELRTAGLAEHRDQRLIIHDLKGLERYAEFNPAYLYMEQVQP